jgi:acetoin utilization protein AcuB
MLVNKRMSSPVITITPETTFQEAVDLIHKEHIRRLPVVDKHGKLVGIVTEHDLMKASPSDATTLDVYEIRNMMSRLSVERIMVRDVITVDDDCPVEEAARLMVDHKISGLPVMRAGQLVGIITETNLFKMFLEMLGAREPGLRVTVAMSKAPGQLAKLARAIFDAGGNIISMSTFMGESSEAGDVTFKVDGVSQEAVEKAIKPLVKEFIDIRKVDCA